MFILLVLYFLVFFRSKDKKFLDVWPVNFLKPSENDAFDTTSLFMMQLACIVNMVQQWSNLTLRVCVCDEVRQGSFSLNATVQSRGEKLKHLLKMLRISAELYPVSGWNSVVESHETNTERYYDRLLFVELNSVLSVG